jgi:hypothetical protein
MYTHMNKCINNRKDFLKWISSEKFNKTYYLQMWCYSKENRDGVFEC